MSDAAGAQVCLPRQRTSVQQYVVVKDGGLAAALCCGRAATLRSDPRSGGAHGYTTRMLSQWSAKLCGVVGRRTPEAAASGFQVASPDHPKSQSLSTWTALAVQARE